MKPQPKALVFDVFGTCVDWRSSIAREGEGRHGTVLEEEAQADVAIRRRVGCRQRRRAGDDAERRHASQEHGEQGWVRSTVTHRMSLLFRAATLAPQAAPAPGPKDLCSQEGRLRNVTDVAPGTGWGRSEPAREARTPVGRRWPRHWIGDESHRVRGP